SPSTFWDVILTSSRVIGENLAVSCVRCSLHRKSLRWGPPHTGSFRWLLHRIAPSEAPLTAPVPSGDRGRASRDVCPGVCWAQKTRRLTSAGKPWGVRQHG